MSKQPDGLENKFRILSLLPFDKRIGRRHSSVMAFIMDWHHRKYGDALASVRHIVAELKKRDPFDKGFFTGDVHGALTDLVEWGYLAQQKGSGRRASRYIPNWSIFDSVQDFPNATDTEISVLENPNASVRESPNTTGNSVQESQNEDPSTVTRLQDGVTEIDGTALPPPATDALGGAVGGAGFEELWRAYGYRREKTKAKAEFAKLKPTPEGMVDLIAAAAVWRDAWAAQGKADAPRMHLATWIKDERFDEDPPKAFTAKAPRSKSVMKVSDALPPHEAPANDNSSFHRAPDRIQRGRHRVAIVSSQVDRDGFDATASFHIDVAGTAFTLGVAVESSDQKLQDAGQWIMSRLSVVTDKIGATNTDEFHNIPFDLEVLPTGELRFYRIAADAAEVTA